MKIDLRSRYGRAELAFAALCKVFVDDQELKYCRMADEQAGIAVAISGLPGSEIDMN